MTTLQESRDPVVRREIDVGESQRVSLLAWREGDPLAVLLHGRGQNAHTWTAVARTWSVPLIAVDHPGHGHSDWRDDHDYGPVQAAKAIAVVVREFAPNAEIVVGMSLGGLTLIRLAETHPELVRRAVVVDSTPASRDGRPGLTREQQGAVALLGGPTVFDTFEEMFTAAAEVVTNRPLESLRRGVERNSKQLDDGRWTWRYDPQRPAGRDAQAESLALWDDLEAVRAPMMLVRSGRSGRVKPEDVAEFRRRQPTVRVEVVEEAGHSIQSDQPEQLTALLAGFVSSTP
jgi:esterase